MYKEDIKDKRKEKRVGLVYNLAVFDRISGEVYGYLADITPSGFMLLCEKQLELKNSTVKSLI